MPVHGGTPVADTDRLGHLDKENTDPDNRNSRLAHGKMSHQVESSKKLEPLNFSNNISTNSFASINGIGLITPPPSQSPTEMDRNNMLISPPPEEILRSAERRVPRRPSVHFKDTDIHEELPSMSHANSSKRKRSTINRVQFDLSATESAAETSQAGAIVTPNPRLRKQTKRTSHVRTLSNASNSSQTSPTQATFLDKISTPDKLLGESSKSHLKSAKGKVSPVRMKTDSPHTSNPNADFILHWPRRKRDTENIRSSSIPYEPPRERFTPPREIMSTPSAPLKAEKSKSIRKRTPVLEAKIKTEPPQINLNVPPPSPSDDPILLIGSPQPEPRPLSKMADRSTSPIRIDNDLTQLADMQMDLDISGFSTTATPERPSAPVFNIDWDAPAADANWSDSDDEVIEDDEGEYTGKFKAFKIPIKADPPTSGTRGRMEEWGRPISPHPFKSLKRLSGMDEEFQTDTPDEELPIASDQDYDVFLEESTPRRNAPSAASLLNKELEIEPPVQVEDSIVIDAEENDTSQPEEEEVFNNSSYLSSSSEQVGSTQGEQDSDDEHLAEVDESLDEDDALTSFVPQNDLSAEKHRADTVLFDEPVPKNISADVLSCEVVRRDLDNTSWDRTAATSSKPLAIKEFSTFHRESSNRLQIRNDPSASLPVDIDDDVFNQHNDEMEVISDAASSDGSDSEDADDPGIIKIVSDDPLAAARAALILKQHQYDLVALRSPKKKKRSLTNEDAIRKYRRKSVVQAGIIKSPNNTSKRRQTFGGFADGKVFIPGSAAMTVPEFLEKAEAELEQSQAKLHSPAKSAFGTPKMSSTSSNATSIPPLDLNAFVPAAESQVWSKEDWKLLDRCFLDERCEMAEDREIDIVVDMKDVVLDNVVERFITMSGGQDVIDRLGVDWSKNRLLKRAGALCRRQRELDGSPLPTNPLRMQSFGSPSMSDISTISFTPTPAERFQRPLYPIIDAADKSFPTSKLSVAFPTMDSPLTPPSARNESVEPSIQENPSECGDSQDTVFDNNENIAEIVTPEKPVQATPSSVVRRSFNYLYSWLGKSHNAKPHQKGPLKPMYPALPVPPSEVRSKPRGPVTTPARKPADKTVPPKDQVSLKHASPPPDPRTLFHKPPQPKRIVELKKAALPSSPKPAPQARPRTVSSGSVKDLVKGFEDLQQKEQVANKTMQNLDLKRTRSVGDLKGKKTSTKPTWRP